MGWSEHRRGLVRSGSDAVTTVRVVVAIIAGARSRRAVGGRVGEHGAETGASLISVPFQNTTNIGAALPDGTQNIPNIPLVMDGPRYS